MKPPSEAAIRATAYPLYLLFVSLHLIYTKHNCCRNTFCLNGGFFQQVINFGHKKWVEFLCPSLISAAYLCSIATKVTLACNLFHWPCSLLFSKSIINVINLSFTIRSNFFVWFVTNNIFKTHWLTSFISESDYKSSV